MITIERHEMTPRIGARSLLAADGAGCAAAAAAVLMSRRAAVEINPSMRARWPVVGALGATSAMLVAASMPGQPTERDLRRAAVVNVGWVAVCLMGLRARPSRVGAALLTGTAVFDGVAAIAQWRLASDAQAVDSGFNAR